VGKRESYEPGTFCWVDLTTTDAEGAKAFYGELFGWEFRDDEIPGGGKIAVLGDPQGPAFALFEGETDE
jgi:predicted enzyme related to lactoylglutathione lyase